ncbi:MAG: cyclic nucleotide-binding domain-containing protein [Desulfobacterales bacterium]|nr:cyclic nucleotide-binding domain-containing protein [Desulfobacterales bacterium]MDX2512773.1 cyclic nucleotide-binding domain-containing protein [Desulfobacterales bacterium]
MSSLETDKLTTACELDQNLQLLRQTYFFSVVPLEALKVFSYLCSRERFKAGEYLFRQGEDDGQAFYIISGTAVLERKGGDLIREIRQCSEGEFMGGLSLMGSMRRLFSLKAVSEMNCLILTREKFTRSLSQFPDLMPSLFKALVGAVDGWEKGFLSGCTDQRDECLQHLGVSLL